MKAEIISKTLYLPSACAFRSASLRPTWSTASASWRPFRVCRGRRQRNFFCAAPWTNPAAGTNNRGVLNVAKGEADKAIADFVAAIRLNPNDPIALANRGYMHETKGEYDQTISDFNEAIRSDPYGAPLYFNRGVARLYSGRTEAAAQDFAIAVRLRPSDAYAVIWLHLARVRTGQDDQRELTQTAAKIDRAKWPGLLVDLYRGSVSREALSGAAISDQDGKMQRKRACDIEFYLGAFNLEQGARDEAQQHLRAAADICAPGGIERIAARAELDGTDRSGEVRPR